MVLSAPNTKQVGDLMADNYLITGYWGEPHVTAENDRGINAAMFGTGRFVLPVGEQFKAEYIGNNTIRMYDGKLMDNGAAAGIPVGEYVDLLISNAGQGMKRNDLIVFQYEQDSSTLVESGKFVVIQGAESSGTASDPALTQADLLSGEAVFDQMALWQVSVSGATISAPVKLFSVYKNNVSHAADKNNPHEVTAEQVGTIPVINYNNTGCYYRESYGVVEWINPPFALNEEYRTIERYKGLPVYAKAVELDLAPSGSKYVWIASGITNVVSIEGHAFTTDGSQKIYPIARYAANMTLNIYGNLIFNLGESAIAYPIVKYTK